jgi:hypothetical protein
MPPDAHEKRGTDQDKQDRQQRHAAISRCVLLALGRPGDLRRVQVRRLWGDRYWVNVFVGADAASARVAHSYCLAADGGGNVTGSSPEITRQY